MVSVLVSIFVLVLVFVFVFVFVLVLVLVLVLVSVLSHLFFILPITEISKMMTGVGCSAVQREREG